MKVKKSFVFVGVLLVSCGVKTTNKIGEKPTTGTENTITQPGVSSTGGSQAKGFSEVADSFEKASVFAGQTEEETTFSMLSKSSPATDASGLQAMGRSQKGTELFQSFGEGASCESFFQGLEATFAASLHLDGMKEELKKLENKAHIESQGCIALGKNPEAMFGYNCETAGLTSSLKGSANDKGW